MLDTELRTFLALSLVLTGEAALDRSLAASHLERLRQHPLGGALGPLLARFRELDDAGGDLVVAVRDRVMGDSALAPLAKVVTFLWFAGGFATNDGHVAISSAEQYFGARVWDAVGAHPPGLSNGYFGHWKYPVGR